MPRSRGFTLIELIIVTAIIGILTVIVFVSQGSFNKTLILANTAYDVALSLQSAETYGLGGRSIGTTPIGYGIHVDKTHLTSFLFFADTVPAIHPGDTGTSCHPHDANMTSLATQPGDCVYTAGSDQIVSTATFGNGITIDDACAITPTTSSCMRRGAQAIGTGPLSSLDIVFARPNPTPLMSMNGTYQTGASQITEACIVLASPQGGTRFVVVNASGQISASASPCK